MYNCPFQTQLKGENPLRPGYYICLDRSSNSVVLVIRGTLTLSDALTDASCLSKEFLGGWAHHGIRFVQVASRVLAMLTTVYWYYNFLLHIIK